MTKTSIALAVFIGVLASSVVLYIGYVAFQARSMGAQNNLVLQQVINFINQANQPPEAEK